MESSLKVMRMVSISFMILLAVFLSACPGPRDDDGDDGREDTGGIDEVLTFCSVSRTAGGLLQITSDDDDELNGVSVDIPADAVSETTTISIGTVESVPSDSPFGQSPVGKLLGLEPHGLNFDEDVTLSLPIPLGGINTGLYIGRWDKTNKKWENLGGTIDGDFISTKIDHLSIYGVFYEGKSHVELVNEAADPPADLGIEITYVGGPAPPPDLPDGVAFPAYRPLPAGGVDLEYGQSRVMALLPGRYHFLVSYPHPQPGVANSLFFTIPKLTEGADDGQIDQTITITLDGATSTDSFTDDSIAFAGASQVAGSNLRPIIACTATAPAGVPVVNAVTGGAPNADPRSPTATRIINVGPIKVEQLSPSGALTLSGTAYDPEGATLDLYWTWSEGSLPTHDVIASGGTNDRHFFRSKGGVYTVYLTVYDQYGLFDQSQWNITVIPNAKPYIDVVVDDIVIDFGRLDSWRRNLGAVPFSGLPGNHPIPFPNINNPLPVPAIPNWCVYWTPPVPAPPTSPFFPITGTASTHLKRILTYDPQPGTTHVNPTQYPGGMTCVYAIVADANGDPIEAQFILPEPIMGKGNLYTAIPVPGIPAGTIIDSCKTLDAYNATLTEYANLGWLPCQPHQPTQLWPPPYAVAPNIPAVSIEPTIIDPIIRPPKEFPYVIAFNNGGPYGISPGDTVTEAVNPNGLIPSGRVYKVILVEGSWTHGTATGYLWMIPVISNFWDPRQGPGVPALFKDGTQVALVSFVGQVLPFIWEAPDDPDVEQTTHDRRHIDPDTIPRGGTVNIEARVTDGFSREQKAFGLVAFPDTATVFPHGIDKDGDGYIWNEDDCDDDDPNIHPGATEICDDGIDNDCDGDTDCDDSDCSSDPVCRCPDADGDGYYAESDCGTEVDCDDTDANVSPGTTEICDDGIDNDCDEDTDCDDSDCSSDPACDESWCVWYADNIGLKPVMVGTYQDFLKERLCRSYPGGGMSPTLMMDKVLIVSGFETQEEAIEKACEQFVNIIRVPGSSTFVWTNWLGYRNGQRHDIDEIGGCQ